ncbi:Hpt domain protein [Hartmannibacter diazotrophicus]|uniref:Hpt domain protein n=1 Tax=Hartmannibacter diazotrophicus TaxID=1482074 RepID=A0A2C9D5N0_9HYPH|nr:Hpt domain-containing protein [Hartmannibacter diazotrophicus]SON55448.1 Hpt domain protein [Hartmannibacter diazotrophicus]
MGQTAEQMEIIPPQVDLRRKVRVLPTKAGVDDAVARAEAAIKKLSTSFNVWIEDEIDQIDSAWETLQSAGLDDDEACQTFYRRAHDLRGLALTLGFPLAGQVAASLCLLFEELPSPTMIPELLVRQHVEAIRAIVRENAREENDRIGAALAEKLLEVTREFIQAKKN